MNLFHAVDSYFANDDYGRGYYDPVSGAVEAMFRADHGICCSYLRRPPPPTKKIGSFNIWAGIGIARQHPPTGWERVLPGQGFYNTIDTSADGVDNGFGLQWQRTLGSGASTTVGDWWTFGSIPTLPGQETPTPTPTQTRTPTATATPSCTPTATVTPGGCSLTPPVAGTVVRMLAYHQLTSFM